MNANEITFTLSPEEFSEAGYLRKRTLLLHYLKSLAVVMGTVAAAVTIGFFMGMPARLYSVVFSTVILMVVMFACLFLLQRYILGPRASRRVLGENASLFEDVSFQWDEEGFVQSNPHFTNNFKWIDVFGFAEGKSIIGLYLSNTRVVIIPKQAFGRTALADFSALLRRKLRVVT